MTDDPGRNARDPRQSVMLNAIVERFGSGTPSQHRVRNLSSGGVRIDQAGALQAGATVLVTVGALQAIGATVMWVDGDSAGLKFTHPVDPEQARAKAAIAPHPLSAPRPAGGGPTAGWVPDRADPYRK